MNTFTTSLLCFVSVFGGAMFGMLLRRMLPEHHLTSETRDTVKLAMGFIATMAALILGLLVASAKDSYDKQASGVTQMAAKIIFLDRLLANFGPETNDIRTFYRGAVEQITDRMWPGTAAHDSQLDPSAIRTEKLFTMIDALAPKSDMQTTLKSQAIAGCLELGQLRWLEYEQASTGASKPMLYILIFWISVLFVSFGMFAPSNGTVVVALLLSAVSVAGAIYLIEELRSPFIGLLQIPKTPFVDAISRIGS